MSLATDLVAYILADAGIAAEIGDKIYPRRAPKSASGKYAVYNRVSAINGHELIGKALDCTGAIYQFDFWADEPGDVEAVAEAFRAAFDGLRGLVGSTEIRRVWLQDERDDLEDLDNADEEGKERITHDYEVIYMRSVPTPTP